MMHFPPPSRGIFLAALFLTSLLNLSAQTTFPINDVPRTISYQGLLSASDGASLPDGRYQITVTLFADPTGSKWIWQDMYTTHITGGLFNLSLGDGNPLPDAVTMNTPLWIGTSIDGGEMMRPLTPLSASPYALNVSNQSITTDKLVDGAVTAEKVNMDYISEIQIDGEKISAKGTVLNLVSTPAVPLTYDETTQSLTVGRLPAQTGDREKGTSILAGGPIVWSVGGDGYDVATATGYTPVASDWIGTQGAVDFLVGVNATQVMNYQVSTIGVPNIIGGDISNTITATAVGGSIIAEGEGNTISVGQYQVISGGHLNSISGTGSSYNVISGGHENQIGNAAGGYDHSGIASGSSNEIYHSLSVIAGGQNNTIEAIASGILGGHDNSIVSNLSGYSAIVGGMTNIIGGGTSGPATHSIIGGGEMNRITNSGAPLNHSVIGGGYGNEVREAEAVIAGGYDNTVESHRSGILGGHGNVINVNSPYSTIGGGNGNAVTAGFSSATIGGGDGNVINAERGTIGGGAGNRVGAQFGTVGGGVGNNVAAAYGTLPGGDLLLTTNSYAQSAMGFMNAPRGTVAIRPTVSQTAAFDDPLFMVGNGDYNSGTPIRSNAFEVSYNGHSVVYDVNGPTNGGGRTPIQGATYTDNIIYAWGDIAAGGAINSDFGVTSVMSGPPGTYTVTINVVDPLGSPVVLNNASITATIVDNTGSYGCTSISTSQIGFPGPNQFTVRTYRGTDCSLDNLPFTFKVCGRP